MSTSPSLFSDVRAELKKHGYILKRFGTTIVEYDGRRVGLLIQRGAMTYIKEVASPRDLLHMTLFMLRCLAENIDASVASAEAQVGDLMKDLDEATAELEHAGKEDKERIEARISRISQKIDEANKWIAKASAFVEAVAAFLEKVKDVDLW
jgi:hypothetical protein